MRGKARYWGLIIFTICTIGLYGQKKAEITITLSDSITGEVLPFATVQLFSLPDSLMVSGGITNDLGTLKMDKIRYSDYLLIASYMGFEPDSHQIQVNQPHAEFNFKLIPKNVHLGEVEITGEKILVEKTIEKTTVNISQVETITGGTALDAVRTLPSVDVDIDDKIVYRGSDKVMILINGEKSELVKSLSQIPADRIDKIELINNPSSKYESEGMSGIINIVLKSGSQNSGNKTIQLYGGVPVTFGGNAGLSAKKGKTDFFLNAGGDHKEVYQSKEHLRKNYENPEGLNYYQFDEQDENRNNLFINSDINYRPGKRHLLGISALATTKFNRADREIDYETREKTGQVVDHSQKTIDIGTFNYSIDGKISYRYNLGKPGHFIGIRSGYSLFSQSQEMENIHFYPAEITPDQQNTLAEQLNKSSDILADYTFPFNDSVSVEAGAGYRYQNLTNDFSSESYFMDLESWVTDTALGNHFNYIQQIFSSYMNLNARFGSFEFIAGLRGEYTNTRQNKNSAESYPDLFPSVTLSKNVGSKHTPYFSYSRRINRPTIRMLNPYSDEYADLLNQHQGNPDLKPEYVNSFELGNRAVFNKWSAMTAMYYRHINQAISRIKSASNDSALTVTFMNLGKAELFGLDFSATCNPVKWWTINLDFNVFRTTMNGSFENNEVDQEKTAWNGNVSTQFRLPSKITLQVTGHYRSPLPSVTGTYIERYYVDLALSKPVMKNHGKLVFRASDIFNTYLFGLDLDAVDSNNYHYSQSNRRKIQSRYFILSFAYNINGKENSKKSQNENFFLDGFEK